MYRDWHRHIRPLTLPDDPSDPESAPLLPLSPSLMSFSHFVSARTLIASRGFTIDEWHGEGMVPIADL